MYQPGKREPGGVPTASTTVGAVNWPLLHISKLRSRVFIVIGPELCGAKSQTQASISKPFVLLTCTPPSC